MSLLTLVVRCGAPLQFGLIAALAIAYQSNDTVLPYELALLVPFVANFLANLIALPLLIARMRRIRQLDWLSAAACAVVILSPVLLWRLFDHIAI